jgi:twitching motility two-component system response regulator PilH
MPVTFKLLVADDDKDLQKALKRVAERAGYEVCQAFDGARVLDAVKGGRPHLILLDVTMPGADGRDVLRQLKQDPDVSSIPVLICSGRTSHTDRIAGLELGAEDYIEKPFNAALLMNKIARLIEKSSQPAAITDAGLVRTQLEHAIEAAQAGQLEVAEAALGAGLHRLERVRLDLRAEQIAELEALGQRAGEAVATARGSGPILSPG